MGSVGIKKACAGQGWGKGGVEAGWKKAGAGQGWKDVGPGWKKAGADWAGKRRALGRER